MKFWISQWALSRGIFEAEGKLCESYGPHDLKNVVAVKLPDTGMLTYVVKPHWHPTRELAAQRAYVMRDKRIASLERQIAKLGGLEF